MSDKVWTTQFNSGVQQDFDGVWHTTGVEIRLSAIGTLVGGRCYFPTTRPATAFVWTVFRLSDQAIMAQCDLLATFPSGTPTLGAWNSFTSASFSTPGDVALSAYPGESYIVVTATPNDVNFINTGVSYPVTSGGIVSGTQSREFNGGTATTFPTTTGSTTWYPADVEVNAAGPTPATAPSPTVPPHLLMLLAARAAANWQAVLAGAFTAGSDDDTGLTDVAAFTIAPVYTDPAGLTDTTAFTQALVRTDDAGLTDGAALTRSLAPTDDAGLTDAATTVVTKAVTATDDAGLTDARVFALGMVRTDDTGLTDAAALTRSLLYTDDTGLTDASTLNLIHNVTATDDAGLTDSTLLQSAKTVTATDSAGLTDAAALTRTLAPTDSAGLTDTSALTRGLAPTDSAGLTDSTVYAQTLVRTDSAGLTDAATVTPVHNVTATDSAGLTDGLITQTGKGSIFLPTGLIPVRTFSPTELLTGNRLTRFRFDLFNRAEAALGNLDGVEKGSVDFTSSASVHSGGALEIIDDGQYVDWLNHRVKPVVIVEGLPEIPLGMFVFSEAPEAWGDTGRSWPVKLLDKTTILDQDAVDVTYALDAGTVITTAVVTLIASTGETNIAVTPSAATLSGPLTWPAGTTKLKIVNDLLSAAGYFSLFCDANGQYRGAPYVRPAARPIRYEFLDGQQSIYSPDFVIDVDLFGIPNKFIAVGQGDATTAALISTATNTDPASPYSFAARGRWITKSATGVEAASQTILDDYARRRLIELTSPTSSIDVTHLLVPDLTFNDAVRLRRVPAGVDARHVITKMTVTFDPLALVRSTLQEVVDL